jgi:hypothetical protein
VNLSFHAATLPGRTLSEREANHFLRSGVQFFASSPLKVQAGKIPMLADSFGSC